MRGLIHFVFLQDVDSLRGELAKNEGVISELRERNSSYDREASQKFRADLAAAQEFVEDKKNLRKALMKEYKRRAEEEILKNLQMSEALKKACNERGIFRDT